MEAIDEVEILVAIADIAASNSPGPVHSRERQTIRHRIKNMELEEK
jgi:hypothetical protein